MMLMIVMMAAVSQVLLIQIFRFHRCLDQVAQWREHRLQYSNRRVTEIDGSETAD